VAEEVRQHPADGRAAPVLPGNREERAEVRRLVDWFHRKMDREVSEPMLEEKLVSRLRIEQAAAPNVEVMRAARANLRYHLSYLAYLIDQRRWLAGEEMSFADMAAAAHISCLDYLDEIRWEEHTATRAWYQRMKSRPSFRPLLADRVAGVTPPAHYADLDF
jgi:glutathione S-transferase